jgi:phospholipase D1/2
MAALALLTLLRSEHTGNRFGSFVPERPNTKAKWYASGKYAFAAIADAIESAKRQVFITCNWLSPEIYLKRDPDAALPPGQSSLSAWRLDSLLKRKARQGVQVYVLLPQTGQLGNPHTIQKLMSLHPNIHGFCHAPRTGQHNQRVIVVDQAIAFIGSLDLAFGRY